MKKLIVLALVALAVAYPDGDFYDSKYDNFDIDEVIGNDRLMQGYSHCFRGDGKCTPEANDFKKWMPEAISSSCGKCTQKQKVIVAKALKGLKLKLPEDYVKIIKIYDPENKYGDEIQKFIDEYSA